MSKLSVLIPSRKEQFLPQTVDDLFNKAAGEIEVIAVLDGYWPDPILEDRPNLILIHRGKARGMRSAINSGAAIASGEYLMKIDAHCMFADGFDEVLKADCEDNWIVIPRRYSLNAEDWCTNPKGPIDYHYLTCPQVGPRYSMHGKPWSERFKERADVPIDENMSFQGSMWFMKRKHWNWLGGMSEVGYGIFGQEPQEIGNKTWLGGGQVMVNKNTWYAHLHKGKRYGRGYFLGKTEMENGHVYSGHYWMGNNWKDRVHDFDWLVDKFWPVPFWTDDWKEKRDEYHRSFAPKIQP